MVIIIEPELEFDEVELGEAVTSIGGGLSLRAGSAAPCEKSPPKNRKTATTAAKHRNLNSPLNVPSSHPGQDASSHKRPSLSLSAATPSSLAAPNTDPPLLLSPRLLPPYQAYPQYIPSHPTPQLDLFSKEIFKRKSHPLSSLAIDKMAPSRITKNLRKDAYRFPFHGLPVPERLVQLSKLCPADSSCGSTMIDSLIHQC